MTPLPRWSPLAQSPPAFVIDTSIPWDWWFSRFPVGYAHDVIRRMTPTVVAVPNFWSLEITDRLFQRAQTAGFPQADIPKYLRYISAFEVLVDPETSFHAWSDILALADQHSLTVYNAAYLELSLQLRLPLATIDATLSHAAATAGVSIFTP
jgi:predicted nucleic acid-binding protein